jgi:hypothetical protein
MADNKAQLSVRKKHLTRFGELKSEYESNGTRDKHRQINDYIYPVSDSLNDENLENDGRRKDFKILDSTASIAHRKLTSIIYSGITSPAVPWLKLTTENPAFKEVTTVKEYFDEVTRILLDNLAKSNFYVSAKSVYAEISAFGTSAFQVEPDIDKAFRFIPYTIGEYYIDTSFKNTVDTIYREFAMRARNVINQFGKDNVSDDLKRSIKGDKAGSKWVKILHVQEPNLNRDVTKLDARNKPYLSTYYEVSGAATDPPLRVSGYDTQPFVVPRWSVSGSSIWGKGPGEMALGDVMSLQTLEEDILEASAMDLDPAVLANGRLGDLTINSGKGGVTWIDNVETSLDDAVRKLYETNADISKVLLAKADIRDRINSVFFANLLALLSSSIDNTPKTATEVLEAKREELLLLGPIMEQLHPDMIRPIVERCVDILDKAGLLPDPPPEIEGEEIKIEIISLIQLAQRISELTPIEQFTAYIERTAQTFPEIRDKFNADQAADEVANALGVKAGIVNSDEDVATKRAADQAALQAEKDAILAQGAIDSAKTLSETDTSGDNALTALTQGGAS